MAPAPPPEILAHSMDSFGAASSLPHGAGTVEGDTLRFQFTYASGPFRDTFTYNRDTDSWTFRLESGDGRGGWRPFADYTVRRVVRGKELVAIMRRAEHA